MKIKMNVPSAILAAAICAAMAALSARADDPYQYILTPDYDSAAASLADSSSASSSATSLSTGTVATRTAATSLEARYRTWLESDGTTVYSTKFKGCKILFF